MGTWRLILAWLVVAAHTVGYNDIFSIEIGTIAVSAFFFISGFLMPLAYKTYYQKSSFFEGCRRFYINRFLRIYPIYWASLIIMLGILFIHYLLHKAVSQDLLNLSTYTQNFLLISLNQSTLWGGYYRLNNPAWTLDVELQYYLLTPFIILMATHYQILLRVVLVIFSAISGYLFFCPTGLVDIDRSILSWSIFFILGFAFYESVVLQRILSSLPVAVFIVTAFFLAASMSDIKNITTLLTIFGFIVVSAFLLVMQKNRGFGFLDQLAGDLSYPIYILHIVFMVVTVKFLSFTSLGSLGVIPQFLLSLLSNIFVSTIMAYVALRVIADPVDHVRTKIREL